MDEYKSNSYKSRENAERERKLNSVVSGNTNQVKPSEAKKFADIFMPSDLRNVSNYLVGDVVVPWLKKGIRDIVVNGIETILYGENAPKNNNSNKPSYRNYYENRNSTNYNNPPRRTAFYYDEIEYTDRSDAEEVKDQMISIIERYGVVKVSDMFDLSDRPCDYTAEKYGWYDLRSIRVTKKYNDTYVLVLPRPLPVD